MSVLAVAVGGALGASARYLVDQAVSRRAPDGLPAGTLVVNLLGSLGLGLVLGTLGVPADGAVAALVGTGFCGAFTTWSTLALELATLARPRPVLAVAYLVVTLVGGVGAAAVGLALTGGLPT